jgi:hypothetical protein
VDGFIVTRSLSPDRLRDFLDHLNIVHQNIQLTMEKKKRATFHSFT